jgi:NAD(P)-dependent dehydrogenase (short-subunit alcohol dehydrogenase family)
VPLALLGDTECEDFEVALATNLLGPFRLTKALLGALAASARAGTGSVVVNVTSDAAVTPYAGWGAYGSSKAALLHMSRVWHQEIETEQISVLAFDPGDMDTPLHALALPDADRTTLLQPTTSAHRLVELVDAALPLRSAA